MRTRLWVLGFDVCVVARSHLRIGIGMCVIHVVIESVQIVWVSIVVLMDQDINVASVDGVRW